MKKKINIAELLRDCPKGMELDCTMYENLYFDGIDETQMHWYPIKCYTVTPGLRTNLTFSKFGEPNKITTSKCVIFPKGKTTWEGFQRPFKDGDIVCYLDSISIFKEWGDATLFRTYVTVYLHGDSTIDVAIPLFGKSIRREARLATEEEKAKLFQEIKDNGYKWNEETKTLEKLCTIFKVGDKIKLKNAYAKKYDDFNTRKITEIKDSHYILDDEQAMPLSNQYLYELVPNKFDITTLVPFEDKVLVRNDENQKWIPAFWGYRVVGGFITTFGWCKYCIPYKGNNKRLLGTTNDCNDFYKTWEE